MPDGTRFKIIMRKKRKLTPSGGYRYKEQFHIRLLAGNNEITLGGEGLDELASAKDTCESIWRGLGAGYLRALEQAGGLPGVDVDELPVIELPPPPYTKDSL